MFGTRPVLSAAEELACQAPGVAAVLSVGEEPHAASVASAAMAMAAEICFFTGGLTETG